MSELQIKLCGDLILREKCAQVSEITSEIQNILDKMVEIMNNQNGVGLAAPQVGILQRFLVMMNPDTKEIFKMINPRIMSRGEKTCVMEEGCLSVVDSDNMPVYANVSRPETVEVEWADDSGRENRAKMSGLAARIVQHEIDHLDGILFIDYLSPLRREMLMRKVRKRK
ncbi:MAG: peptide deformylase [Rickettsiales bacterium]|jgi:peptide deformylase|nr:peptide deformylase [Rickettsiales bacterium]